jgi:hypothetical protein
MDEIRLLEKIARDAPQKDQILALFLSIKTTLNLVVIQLNEFELKV